MGKLKGLERDNKMYFVLLNFAIYCMFLQLEMEQQKIEEEQENTPEFVKMKSNLRRTKLETDGEERTT